MLDEAEVVLCQIFFNQESVNGCWRAEGARTQPLDGLQHAVRREFLGIVCADAGTADPLTINFTPGEFCPAGIRLREVDTVFLHTLPEARGRDLAERMGVIVPHHFRHAGCTGGEIEQHGVCYFCGVLSSGALEYVALLCERLCKIDRARRDLLAEHGVGFHGWAVG